MPTTWSTTDKDVNITLSNGNLTASTGGTSGKTVRATNPVTGDFSYFEVTTASGATFFNGAVGISTLDYPVNVFVNDIHHFYSYSNGNVSNPGGTFIGTYAAFNDTGPITVGFAVDKVNKKWWISVGGVWDFGNPNTLTGGFDYSSIGSADVFATLYLGDVNLSATANFGASPFVYTPPSGFLAYDTPTGVRWNPKWIDHTYVTLASNNLRTTGASANPSFFHLPVQATGNPATDKFYLEFVNDTPTGSWGSSHQLCFGVNSTALAAVTSDASIDNATGICVRFNTDATGFTVSHNFTTLFTDTTTVMSQGTVVGLAVERSTKKVWVSINGAWINSGNPATGANPFTATGMDTAALWAQGTLYVANAGDPNVTLIGRFTADEMSYSEPSGFTIYDGTSSVPSGTGNNPLLEDGTSHFLLEDGSGVLEFETLSTLAGYILNENATDRFLLEDDSGLIKLEGVASGGSTYPGYVKIWTGSTWVYKPVKRWTGSAWVQKPVKFRTSIAWQQTNGI